MKVEINVKELIVRLIIMFVFVGILITAILTKNLYNGRLSLFLYGLYVGIIIPPFIGLYKLNRKETPFKRIDKKNDRRKNEETAE